MAQSDIEIAGLAKVGETDAKYLVSLIRSIPGFPKEGIIFVISCLFSLMHARSAFS